MSSEPAQVEGHNELREEIRQWLLRVRQLETRTPGSGARLLASVEAENGTRSVLEALLALLIDLDRPRAAIDLAELLDADGHDPAGHEPDNTAGRRGVRAKPAGAARKVSVSMPEDLTSAVQRRVGRGKFSQYVTEAVSRQLELDLLVELSELLAAEHGPVPEKYLTEARAAWPDDE
ncbi:MAG: hypothetical protein ACRDOD_25985 [Streptosporangiaceae bacterium]